MAGLVPAIHAEPCAAVESVIRTGASIAVSNFRPALGLTTWMAGTSPAMTI
jgi:hypothetical protein